MTGTRTAARLAAGLAGLLMAAGCGGAGPTSSATAGTTTQDTPAANASPTTPTRGATGRSTGGGRTPTPTPRRTPSPSPTVAGLPEVLSFAGTPNCAGTTGKVSMRLTWTSKNATEAWISTPIIASAAGDPKTTQGASGPLPANGSLTLPFDCANQYNYYDLGVYGGGHSHGEILQVARNV